MKRDERIDAIIDHCAKRLEVTRDDILSHRRAWAISRPRMIAVFLCRLITQRSYQEIAYHFNKDHSSIVSAVQRLEWLRDNHPHYDYVVKMLYLELMNSDRIAA